MKLPFVPGPTDVLNAVGGVRDGVSEALALVPRIGSVVHDIERLMERVSAVVTRIEQVVDHAETALGRAEGTLGLADSAMAGVARTQARADDAITAVGKATSRAEDTVGRVEGLLVRLDPVLDGYEGPLVALAPSLHRLAETLEPHEVDAMVTLVDRLPTVVTHLDEDVLPVLASLDNVAPDVHALLDTVEDVRQIVKGFPGSRLFRRRGAEEIAAEEADEVEEAERAGSPS